MSSPISSYAETFKNLEEKINNINPKILSKETKEESSQSTENVNDIKDIKKVDGNKMNFFGNIFSKVKSLNPIILSIILFFIILLVLFFIKPKFIKKDEKTINYFKLILFSFIGISPFIAYLVFKKFKK